MLSKNSRMSVNQSTYVDEEEFACFKKSLRGVKDLVDNGIQEIPKFYIRSYSRMKVQSSTLPPEDQVPVIDLARLDGPERAQVIQKVAKAAEEWGFFQVVNHGLQQSVMQAMLDVVKEFFDMTIEERMSFYSANLWKTTRFGTSHNLAQETSLEWKDYLRHPCLPLEVAIQSWPTKPEAYREVASNYCKGVKKLGDVLLGILSESLGLETNHLDKVFGEEKMQEMFSNYYPPCPNPELTIGIGEHSDAGGITILLQNEVEGLEVFNKDQWLTIKPVKDALVVNIGDQIQILTNGKFKSVEHRAKVSSKELRISIPTFYQPSKKAEISPIAELLNEEHPPLYRKVQFEDYVHGFFKLKLHGEKYIDTYKIRKC